MADVAFPSGASLVLPLPALVQANVHDAPLVARAAQYTTWSSVKNLDAQGISDVLLGKGVDIAECLGELLGKGLVTHTRSIKKNLELVWKERKIGEIVNGRNTRLNIHTATQYHLENLTETKSQRIQEMVDAAGKSKQRQAASERTFNTFELYASAVGIDAKAGTDIRLPNTIAAWLGLIAGIGGDEEDEGQLTAIDVNS